MARRSRIANQSEDTELNMTPMLDVVFILLIFFIVTSVFVKTPGIEPNVPEAQTRAPWTPGILVAVNAQDEVWIDKQVYDLDEVRPVVRAIRDENPKATAILQVDGEASVGIGMELQQMMQDLQIPTRVKTT